MQTCERIGDVDVAYIAGEFFEFGKAEIVLHSQLQEQNFYTCTYSYTIVELAGKFHGVFADFVTYAGEKIAQA